VVEQRAESSENSSCSSASSSSSGAGCKAALFTCQGVLPGLGKVLWDGLDEHAVLLLTQLAALLGQCALQAGRQAAVG
jgi:hypothetical protein